MPDSASNIPPPKSSRHGIRSPHLGICQKGSGKEWQIQKELHECKEHPDKNHERPPCLKISDAKRMVQLARLLSSFAIFCLRAHPCPLVFSKWRTEPGSVRQFVSKAIIHRTASSTQRVGIGLRPGRPSASRK